MGSKCYNRKPFVMIKKIYQAQNDLDELSSKKMPEAGEYFDYRNIIVNKPWGYEYLMFENEHVAIWILFLKKGASTSMHCHPKKKTSLLVLGGGVQTSSLSDSFSLACLDSIVIDKGVFHSTANEFSEGAFIMEIESPPDKADLVRLRDEYGRENKGYENSTAFSTELENYEHQSFHDELASERSVIAKMIRESRINLHTREDMVSLQEEMIANDYKLVSLLDASLLDSEGNVVLETGEICEKDWFLNEGQNLRPDRESFTALTVY